MKFEDWIYKHTGMITFLCILALIICILTFFIMKLGDQEKEYVCDIEHGYYGFKVICYDDYFGKNNIRNPIDQHYFGSLYDCKKALNYFIDDKNCEVIK